MKTRRKHPDLTNETFGRLKVLYRAPNCRGRVAYQCECICGEFRVVRASSLVDGCTRSCGCLRREKAIEKILSGVCEREFKHGFATRNGQSKVYQAWLNYKTRFKDIPDFPEFYAIAGPEVPGARLRRLSNSHFQWRRGDKLNMEQAREIRAHAANGKTQNEIALQFGIGKSMVSSIVRHEKWKELDR